MASGLEASLNNTASGAQTEFVCQSKDRRTFLFYKVV